jgi:hypothetical protein
MISAPRERIAAVWWLLIERAPQICASIGKTKRASVAMRSILRYLG